MALRKKISELPEVTAVNKNDYIIVNSTNADGEEISYKITLANTLVEGVLPSYVDDVIEGYYYNNKFYKDAEHTIEITGEAHKIYVDVTTNATYRWSEGTSSFVLIGTTDVYTKAEIDAKLATKQEVLTAGTNITIENNVISSTDTKYTVTVDI